jgi:NTP pyrophosphatase (non-canonical NTP hydrolase)
MGSQNALTGLVEEVGELNHVTICRHQGRRGYDVKEKYEADRNDALADIMVFLCDYAAREGVDLLTVVNDTWNKVVSKRTLQNWDKVSHETDNSKFEKTLVELAEKHFPDLKEQTGQGFAEPPEQEETKALAVRAGVKLMTAHLWAEKAALVIMDPDGWRRDNKSLYEAIDCYEFIKRVDQSTVKLTNNKRRCLVCDSVIAGDFICSKCPKE